MLRLGFDERVRRAVKQIRGLSLCPCQLTIILHRTNLRAFTFRTDKENWDGECG